MPAAVRGGSRVKAKPPTRTPAAKAAQSGQSKPRAQAPAANEHHGLSPKWALIGAGTVLAMALAATLATGHRGERLVAAVGHGVDGRLGDLGFRLQTVEVLGASRMATADIVKAAGVYKDQPLLGLDLSALRRKVEAVGWVKEAHVVRLLPDTLVISVTERRQLAVWQHNGRQVVIDANGQVIPEADPGRFPTLPLIVGEGGAAHAPAILPLVAQRPRLMGQLDALVRVDDRRWDLRLKDGSLIQLPAEQEEAALMQLERLDQRSRILELGFERIDLRNPDVVAVRPRAAAPLAPQPAAAGA
jgi:cell division protein FtsQ